MGSLYTRGKRATGISKGKEKGNKGLKGVLKVGREVGREPQTPYTRRRPIRAATIQARGQREAESRPDLGWCGYQGRWGGMRTSCPGIPRK